MPETFTFYEFFAGSGLVRLALEPRWTCVWANDLDPRKAATYTQRFGADRFALGDVAKVSASTLPQGATLAWASFPCQDLSLAGRRRGISAARSGTFWAFWRILRDLYDQGNRPPLVAIENVTGLLHSEDFAVMCQAFAAIDLQFGALVVDARHFLPQSRPRVFVVAVDRHLDCSAFVQDAPCDSPWFPHSVVEAQRKLPLAVRKAWRWWRLPVPHPSPVTVVDLMEEEPTGVSWHSAAETKRLLGLMLPIHRRKVRVAQRTGGRQIGFLYKRTRGGAQRAEVRFDGVAGCLRAPTGGSSRQTVLVVDGRRLRSRLLSSRETARLMGVPDTFRLPDNYNDGYRAMGDGVAVPVLRWLAELLLSPLAMSFGNNWRIILGAIWRNRGIGGTVGEATHHQVRYPSPITRLSLAASTTAGVTLASLLIARMRSIWVSSR